MTHHVVLQGSLSHRLLIKGMCEACLLFGILPMGGDF